MKTKLLRKLRKECDKNVYLIREGHIACLFFKNIYYNSYYCNSTNEMKKILTEKNRDYIHARVVHKRKTYLKHRIIKNNLYNGLLDNIREFIRDDYQITTK